MCLCVCVRARMHSHTCLNACVHTARSPTRRIIMYAVINSGEDTAEPRCSGELLFCNPSSAPAIPLNTPEFPASPRGNVCKEVTCK